MAEKLIFQKKRYLIQRICRYIGFIGFSHECEKNFLKIIFIPYSDDCNVCEKELPTTDDHCHLVWKICHDKLQKN